MAFDLNRWMKYARARLDAALKSGNRELDRREAELEADRADRPWLGDEEDVPTVDEVAARIRWEREEAERRAQAGRPTDPQEKVPPTADRSVRDPAGPGTEPPAAATPPAPTTDTADAGAAGDPSATPSVEDEEAPTGAPADGDGANRTSTAGPRTGAGNDRLGDPTDPLAPATPEEAAQREQARIDLEARERAAHDRLDQIRKDLGAADPPA